MIGEEVLRSIVASCGFGAKLGQMIVIAKDDHTWTLSPSNDLIGNPLLPALHGGAVTAFIQLACGAAVARASGRSVLPRLISANVQFLAPMRLQDISTVPVIRRIGRRVAAVHADAWQTDREQPVCAVQCEFSLAD